MHRRTRHALAVLYFCASTSLLIWPLYPWWGNHVHPRVMGLPFSLVSILAVVAANFAVLAVLYRTRFLEGGREDG